MKTLGVAIAVLVAACWASGNAQAEGCNIANVLFGKVRIELIQHSDYQIGIIFGGDFDSKRFDYYRILGRIDAPERDGSRRIVDVNGELCGIIESDLRIDLSDAECTPCSKRPVHLRRVGSNYVVLQEGTIMGTINGSLPSTRSR